MLKEQQLQFIKDNYKKIKAKEIALKTGLTTNQVYSKAKEMGLNSKLNAMFDLTDVQRQILIGGKLGDGSFKSNGPNHYYRECHATPEKEYLLWKYYNLYDITTKKIYNIPSRGVNQNPQISFQTINSSVFTKIANLSTEQTIAELDELGFLIWVLDDGWISYNHICISPGALTSEQMDLVIDQVYRKTKIVIHKIGVKRIDFSISPKYNNKIISLIKKYFDKEIDVIAKKISPLRIMI